MVTDSRDVCFLTGQMEAAAGVPEGEGSRQATHRLLQLLHQCGGRSSCDVRGQRSKCEDFLSLKDCLIESSCLDFS